MEKLLATTTELSTKSKNQSRSYGLDLLKAIAICFVMLIHLQPFQVSPLTTSSGVSFHFKVVSLFLWNLNVQVYHLAVPVFFLISLYLFHKKFSNDFSYLKYRLPRLLKLYIFWTTIQFLVYYLTAVCSYIFRLDLDLPKTSIVEDIVSGGPSLPVVYGISVFYFLFNLVLLTVLASLYARLGERVRVIVGAIVIFLSLVYFEILAIYNYQLVSWRLDNFLLYIPIAYFLIKCPQNFNKLKYYILSGYILFVIHDLFLEKLGHVPNEYGRISILLGALTLFCFIHFHTFKGKNRCVQFLSKYSLGLYAVHKYWQLVFVLLCHQIFPLLSIPESIAIYDLQFSLINPTVAVIAVGFSAISVYMLSFTRLKDFV